MYHVSRRTEKLSLPCVMSEDNPSVNFLRALHENEDKETEKGRKETARSVWNEGETREHFPLLYTLKHDDSITTRRLSSIHYT